MSTEVTFAEIVQLIRALTPDMHKQHTVLSKVQVVTKELEGPECKCPICQLEYMNDIAMLVAADRIIAALFEAVQAGHDPVFLVHERLRNWTDVVEKVQPEMKVTFQ